VQVLHVDSLLQEDRSIQFVEGQAEQTSPTSLDIEEVEWYAGSEESGHD